MVTSTYIWGKQRLQRQIICTRSLSATWRGHFWVEPLRGFWLPVDLQVNLAPSTMFGPWKNWMFWPRASVFIHDLFPNPQSWARKKQDSTFRSLPKTLYFEVTPGSQLPVLSFCSDLSSLCLLFISCLHSPLFMKFSISQIVLWKLL